MSAMLNESVVVRTLRAAVHHSRARQWVRHTGRPLHAVADVCARALSDPERHLRMPRAASVAGSSVLVRGATSMGQAAAAAWDGSMLRHIAAAQRARVASLDESTRRHTAAVILIVASMTHVALGSASSSFVGRWWLLPPALMTVFGLLLLAATHGAVGRGRKIATVAAGAAVGAFYTLSPLTVAYVLFSAWLVTRVPRSLPVDERRRFALLFGAAAVTRLLAVALLPVSVSPGRGTLVSFFGDGVYAVQRSIWIRNIIAGVPVAPLQAFEAFHPEYGYTAYHHVLAYLQLLFGTSPFGLHLFSAALFLAAAAVLYWQMRRSYGPRAATGAAAVILFLPSLFVWSVSPMKEAIAALLLALLVVSVCRSAQAQSWPMRLAWVCSAAALLAAIQPLRAGSLAIAAGGLCAGVLLYVASRRRGVALLVTLLVTALFWAIISRPAWQESARATVRAAAVRHIGHVLTPGASYRALDSRFYLQGHAQDMTDAEALRFLARSAVAFWVEPVPWRAMSRVESALVPQQIVWYGLVVLAIAGLAAALRRDPLLAWLLLGLVFAGMAVIAPNSGNIGTLVRHRDMVVPFVACLAAVGIVRVLSARPGIFSTREEHTCR